MENSVIDARTLKQIQKCGRYVMAEFDRVCTELGLRYVVYGGSAIGAIRHQGFIPWDDDVDVCMPREDYDVLLEKAPQVLGDHFILLDYKNNPDYPKTFGLLGLRGSEFIPEVAAKRKFKVPIGVDIFPLDRLATDDRELASQARQTWIWGRLLYIYGTPTANLAGPVVIQAPVKATLRVIHAALHLLRIKPNFLAKKWEQAARRCENSNGAYGDFSTRDPRRWSATEEELFPAKRMPFDDISVMAARQYDVVLTRHFGDYMAMPAQEDRVNHEAASVKFGPYFSIEP
ncbi:LicD family protein [Trueperella pecoris]|uniref:LicD family protein n=1 Tax=Trueperella pecoris TaxID=2733571 RepID=A0A7M1QVZ4_9ACTO|nr:LicD family protein [Trueperella pecoris]QOQ39159.1 LicD family protein [Trueperella pecoris]QOR46210.1 LicD family protein [Trueperella pecoris]QTG76035.1 LicD family protein [Trueperella pecoris]